ncbi:unnamed protein product [Litomosoides sigmodontis]|uniref:Uncharacterized protein n=1 Tax=Litomosoides sigmodontis TaxID=42156 RepID=A0A3P6UVB4_LITSI|nr:unnamed protein product [Litomosoides sigmodontis]
MSSSNKNSGDADYCGYWQLYPTNTRTRRRFLQFRALKNGGPFCMRVITAFTVAYHVVYYTYQFTVVNTEHRQDLRHVMWLKQKLSFYTFCIRDKGEIANDLESSS